MTVEQVLAVIGLIGIGSIVPSIVTYIVGSRKKKSDAKQELKEERYKVILLLCYAYGKYERVSTLVVVNRPNLSSKEELLNELMAEWANMAVYASDNLILKMKNLLEKRNTDTFNSLIIEMRKDLYGVKTKLTTEIFELEKTKILPKNNTIG